jgi:hypothetical protein
MGAKDLDMEPKRAKPFASAVQMRALVRRVCHRLALVFAYARVAALVCPVCEASRVPVGPRPTASGPRSRRCDRTSSWALVEKLALSGRICALSHVLVQKRDRIAGSRGGCAQT